MKIQGYPVGTEVKWNDETTNGFRTGIVRARYYDPDVTEINGEEIEINVIDCSPTYKVKDKMADTIIVINHSKVVMRHQNDHT